MHRFFFLLLTFGSLSGVAVAQQTAGPGALREMTTGSRWPHVEPHREALGSRVLKVRTKYRYFTLLAGSPTVDRGRGCLFTGTINFGDGDVQTFTSAPNRIVEHVYGQPGTFTFRRQLSVAAGPSDCMDLVRGPAPGDSFQVQVDDGTEVSSHPVENVFGHIIDVNGNVVSDGFPRAKFYFDSFSRWQPDRRLLLFSPYGRSSCAFSVAYNFGDGNANVVSTATKWPIAYTYAKPGRYLVRQVSVPADVGSGCYPYVQSFTVFATRKRPTMESELQNIPHGWIAILGDSYSSGEGGSNRTKDGYLKEKPLDGCDVSPNGYGFVAAKSLFLEPVVLACQGAEYKTAILDSYSPKTASAENPTTTDCGRVVSRCKTGFSKKRPQVDALADEVSKLGVPRFVALTIGGNDVGFARILKDCVIGGCDEALSAVEQDSVFAGHAERVSDTLRRVKQVLPQTPVLVLEYPAIFSTNTQATLRCPLSDEERARVFKITERVNQATRRAAQSVGATFVATNHGFKSHRLCDINSDDGANNWFVDLSQKINGDGQNEPGHPNRFGYEFMAKQLLACFFGQCNEPASGDGVVS